MNNVIIDDVNNKISIFSKHKIGNTIGVHIFDGGCLNFKYIGLHYIHESVPEMLSILDVHKKLFKSISYDTLFNSENFKNLSIQNQLDLLYFLKSYKAKYTEDVYYNTLWYPKEIQGFVKEFLPKDNYTNGYIYDD
jgi:hypothetical protein